MAQPKRVRWRSRPVATWALRALIALVPVAASIATGVAVSRVFTHPAGVLPHIGWLLVVLAASAVTFALVGRGVRRLLPLAMLLRLALVFPDRAPSRFAIALRASNPKRLQAWARGEVASGVRPEAARQAETVLTLIVALGAHDRRTRGHSERVQALTDLMARELALPDDAVDRLRWGALLHDIGKLVVPARILNLPGRPSPAELRTIRRHPGEGARLAEPLASWLGEWRHAIDQHHERFDGAGYPEGLAGRDISLAGRIVAVTDAFETMTAVRSYKKAMSVKDARTQLVDCAGTHFDPRVVRTFLGISLGQLRWTVGILAGVGELPLVGVLPRVGVLAGNTLSAAAPAAIAGFGGAAIVSLGVFAPAPTPPVRAQPSTHGAPVAAAAGAALNAAATTSGPVTSAARPVAAPSSPSPSLQPTASGPSVPVPLPAPATTVAASATTAVVSATTRLRAVHLPVPTETLTKLVPAVVDPPLPSVLNRLLSRSG